MSLEKPNKSGEKLEGQKPQVDVNKLRENRNQRSIVMTKAEHAREAQRNREKIVYADYNHGLGKSRLSKERKARIPKMEEGYDYRAVGGVDATVFEEKKIDRRDLLKLAGWAKKFPELYLVEKRIVTNFDTLKEDTNQTEILDIIVEIGQIATELESSKFDLKNFMNTLGKYPHELVYGPKGALNILLAMDRAGAAVKDKNSGKVIYDLRIGNQKLSQASRFTELRSKFEIKEVQTLDEKMADAEKGLDQKKGDQAKVEAIFDRKAFDKNVAEFFNGNYLKEARPDCDVAKEKIKGTYEGGLVINDAKYIIHTKKDKYFVYPSGGKMGAVELKVIKEVLNNKFELVTIAEILTGDLSSEESKKALAKQIVDEIGKHEGGGGVKKTLDKQAEKNKVVGDLGQSLETLGADYSKKYGFDVKFNKVVEKNGDIVFTAKVKNKSGLDRSFHARVITREGLVKFSLSPVPYVDDIYYDKMDEVIKALKIKMDSKIDGMKDFDIGEEENVKKNFLAELKSFFGTKSLGSYIEIRNDSSGQYAGGVNVRDAMCSLRVGNDDYFVYPDADQKMIILKRVDEVKPNKFAIKTVGTLAVDEDFNNSDKFAQKLSTTLMDLRKSRI